MFGRPQLVVLLLLLVAALSWWRMPASDTQQMRTALIMGTLVEIRVNAAEAKADSAIDAAFAELGRVEQLFSTHLAESQISRLSAASHPFEVSPEVAALLQRGQQFARQSNGAFDLGLGALKQLWGVETAAQQIPAAQQLQQALQGTGPESIRLEGQLVHKQQSGLLIDLGGIAKGYAVDRALLVLAEAGIGSAAVNAGGDIGLLGKRADGQPWRIGIQHPRNSAELLTTLALTDQAVVTSGDYERFFERDGVRYHHIFDPRSGKPARGCQSVTVVAADVASADALATAAFVLGPEKGLQLLDGLAQVEGLLVAADGRVLRTAGLAELEL